MSEPSKGVPSAQATHAPSPVGAPQRTAEPKIDPKGQPTAAAKADAKDEPGKGEKKSARKQTFAERCADLGDRLYAAVGGADHEGVDACWDELDGMDPGDAPVDQLEHRALAARFHHLAPRRKSEIEAIGARLDAAMAGDGPEGVRPVPEAVTRAEEEASRVDASLPSDRAALADLREKIAGHRADAASAAPRKSK